MPHFFPLGNLKTGGAEMSSDQQEANPCLDFMSGLGVVTAAAPAAGPLRVRLDRAFLSIFSDAYFGCSCLLPETQAEDLALPSWGLWPMSRQWVDPPKDKLKPQAQVCRGSPEHAHGVIQVTREPHAGPLQTDSVQEVRVAWGSDTRHMA